MAIKSVTQNCMGKKIWRKGAKGISSKGMGCFQGKVVCFYLGVWTFYYILNAWFACFALSMKDKHRLEHLKQVLKLNEMKATTALLPKIEEEWCSFHNLVPSSLHHVSEICMDLCFDNISGHFFFINLV